MSFQKTLHVLSKNTACPFKKHCMSFQETLHVLSRNTACPFKKTLMRPALEAEQGNGGQGYGDACDLAAGGAFAQHNGG
jgi:hypothetical protein